MCSHGYHLAPRAKNKPWASLRAPRWGGEEEAAENCGKCTWVWLSDQGGSGIPAGISQRPRQLL